MYTPVYHPDFLEEFEDIKNQKSKDNICNKIKDILKTINLFGDTSFNNLKKPLQEFKRVHVNKSFVILFKVNHDKKIVCFRKYGHHKDIYK